MKELEKRVRDLPGVYLPSVHCADGLCVFMVGGGECDEVIAVGPQSDLLRGEPFALDAFSGVRTRCTHDAATFLRDRFPFTKPVRVLRDPRSFGVGDRLGIAGPGHIRVFRDYDARPVFAQQSIRELTLTHRTFADVIDAATFAVFREGFTAGFGADGDHLKRPEEIALALASGCTMITLDCSEHIDDAASRLSDDDVDRLVSLPAELRARYLDKDFTVEGHPLRFTSIDLKRAWRVYGNAIAFAVEMYRRFFQEGDADADFELSIDETSSPTTPEQHFFIASELHRHGVHPATIAPRFVGSFQKGVDYVGDLAAFERDLIVHAAIARHFDDKLSIHSGSDKFSVFALIGRHTRGRFHVKTAGTNWLEAMRIVAATDPGLYREVHAYALTVFEAARRFYHVTTDLGRIPDLTALPDAELPTLFGQDDARQLLHITYGFILDAKDADGSLRFRPRLYRLWRAQEEAYAEALHRHIGKHLSLLYSGFHNIG